MTASFEGPPPPVALDLPEALALAAGQNPEVAFAAARYREACARLASARILWLPSLRGGMSYYHHEGPLQESAGRILDVNRSSLQTGLGVGAVGAGTTIIPGVVARFHTTDALFQPRIAVHTARARGAATRTATNDTLLATALAYLDLLGAAQTLRIAEETRTHAEQLAELTATFARTGQGSQADADRARTELVRRRNDVSRAREAQRVAAARLSQRLSIDPSRDILLRESAVVPIDLVTKDRDLRDLVATALGNRPELAEARSLVNEAVQRYRRERFAPLLPSVLLGISQNGFGGGLGSQINNFSGRFDFDAAVYWEVRNLGLGEWTRRREARAMRDQALASQVAVMDRVAREAVEAETQVRARREQMAVARSGVEAATASYERNLARIREGQGLPIEVLQSIQALDEARREYLRTILDYNEAQFRLQRALGWPIHGEGNPPEGGAEEEQ